jgi:hypothetical protein
VHIEVFLNGWYGGGVVFGGFGCSRRLSQDRRGTVVIVAATGMMVLIYCIAIALDLANIYYIKTVNQRIADQAAIAGAFAYSQNGNLTATAQAAAASMAVANGSGSDTVTTSIVSSPSGDGRNAVLVTVTSAVPLTGFGRATTHSAANPNGVSSFNVSASSYAELHEAGPCIIALQSGGFLTTTGSVTTANECSIGSTGSALASNSSVVTALSIYATGAITASGGSTITTTPVANETFPGSSAQTDPFASAGVFSRLSTVAALSAPSFPSIGTSPTGGTAEACTLALTLPAASYSTVTNGLLCAAISFSGGATTSISGIGLHIGLTNLTGVTVNFAAGSYNLYAISNTGLAAVSINLASGTTLYVWNGIVNNGGGSITFNGPGTYYVEGGITNNSVGGLNFNNYYGSTTSSFTISGGIADLFGPMTFPNGTYVITSGDGFEGAGIDVAAGQTAIFGTGSFNIAKGIYEGAGGALTIGSATTAGTLFQIPTATSGGYGIYTAGGGTLTMGSFPNLDINAPVDIQDSIVYLGAGTYTVTGAVTIARSGGASLNGNEISIVASGALNVGAGYTEVDMLAPTTITSSTVGEASTILLASNSTTTSVVSSGTSTLTGDVGAIYTPNASFALSGAILTGATSCLQLVASSITISGNSNLGTNCPSLGSTTASGSVSVVQ